MKYCSQSSMDKEYILDLCHKYDMDIYEQDYVIEAVFKGIDIENNYVLQYSYTLFVSLAKDIDVQKGLIYCFESEQYNLNNNKEIEYHLKCLYDQYHAAKEKLKTDIIDGMCK